MRILHVVPQLGFGGAERLATDIVLEINRQGHHVAALLSFIPHVADIDQFPGFAELRGSGALLFHHYYGVQKRTERLNALMKVVQDFAPDVVHTHLFEADILMREAVLPGVKYFSHFHDNMWQVHQKGRGRWWEKTRWMTLYERQKALRLYRQSHNRFFAISRDTLAYFTAHLPADLHRFTLLPNAINTARYQFPERPYSVPNFLYFCTIGSLSHKKNQIFLVEVADHLRRRGLNFQVDVLGMGINFERIANRIRELGLEKQVIMHGNIDDVPAFLKRSFLYLHSATYEPFGLVLLEAMASGLPVVCLDGKGNRDILESGHNGTLLPEPNAEAFADAIFFYVNNPEAYRSQGFYAAEYALQFDLAHYCQKLIQAYHH